MSVAALTAAIGIAGCGEFGSIDTSSDTGGGTDETSLQALRVVETDYFGQPFPEAAADAGCTDVETVKGGEIENYGREHVDTEVDYEENPPTSGNHDATPIDWGWYDKEQDTQQWVHNLEHGHVVIAHKGLTDEQVDELKDMRDKAPWHILGTPRDDNPKDGVYFLAWDARLFCAEPNADAFQWFIDNHRDNGPELIMADQPADEEELAKLTGEEE